MDKVRPKKLINVTPLSTGITCGDPGTVTYSARSGKGFMYGDKVKYTCAPGYEGKSGAATVTCLSSKAWSTKPVCGRK